MIKLKDLLNETIDITTDIDKVANEFRAEFKVLKDYYVKNFNSNVYNAIWWDGHWKVMRASQNGLGMDVKKRGIIPDYLFYMSKYRAEDPATYTKLAKQIEKKGIRLDPKTNFKDGKDNWMIWIK